MRIRKLLPSPAMAVAVVALIVAMTGVTYAAGGVDAVISGLKANSVGSKQIKNKQVKHVDIGKNSVHGDNICPDCVGGREVKEKLLGKVPSAGTADLATNANHATNADAATHAQRADSAATVDGFTRFYAKLNDGQDKVVATSSNGALELIAHCDNTGETTGLEIRNAKGPNNGWADSSDDSDSDFDQGDTILFGQFGTDFGDYGAATLPDGSFIESPSGNMWIDSSSDGQSSDFGADCVFMGGAFSS
jgi:hypothetical protein